MARKKTIRVVFEIFDDDKRLHRILEICRDSLVREARQELGAHAHVDWLKNATLGPIVKILLEKEAKDGGSLYSRANTEVLNAAPAQPLKESA